MGGGELGEFVVVGVEVVVVAGLVGVGAVEFVLDAVACGAGLVVGAFGDEPAGGMFSSVSE